MGRCKSLGSMKSFLSYASKLSGATTLFFTRCKTYLKFTIEDGYSLMAARWEVFSFPNALRGHIGELKAGSCDILVYLYGSKYSISPYCFPWRLHQFTLAPIVEEGSFFSIPPPAFMIYRHFDDGHSD